MMLRLGSVFLAMSVALQVSSIFITRLISVEPPRKMEVLISISIPLPISIVSADVVVVLSGVARIRPTIRPVAIIDGINARV